MAESHMYIQKGDQHHTEQIQYANFYNLIEKKNYTRHLIGGGRVNLPPLQDSEEHVLL